VVYPDAVIEVACESADETFEVELPGVEVSAGTGEITQQDVSSNVMHSPVRQALLYIIRRMPAS